MIAAILDRGIDRPLRGIVEGRINAKLVGYSARLSAVDFHLFGLSMDLENVVMIQDAHPDPPVLNVPRLRMGVEWRKLLRLRLVGDALFESPTLHANLVQLRAETSDAVPLSTRGWQRAFESIYPLKINELRIVDGTLAYEDDSGFKPLKVTELEVLAGNIRNIRSAEGQYPSTVHAEGWVFDAGRAVIDGHADFLAEPIPAVEGRLDLERIELSYFQPFAERFGLTLTQGFLSGGGMVELAPGIQTVDLDSIVITAAVIDYGQGAAPTALAVEAGHKISQVARDALNNPEVFYRIKRLLMHNGNLGVVNRTADPPYRLYCSNADFELTNLSSRADDGPALAKLQGAFMGSGAVEGSASFSPEGKHPNFDAKLAIVNTQLNSLNDLLRARGHFDVSAGTFSVYSEVRVKDGYVDGYVKPLFRDVDVYDSAQDKHKNVFRKMYEGVVGGLAKILENRKGEIATVTSLKGPVGDADSNSLQVLGGLMRNAFIQAIRPGFQRELKRLDPRKYRAVQKKAREQEPESARR